MDHLPKLLVYTVAQYQSKCSKSGQFNSIPLITVVRIDEITNNYLNSWPEPQHRSILVRMLLPGSDLLVVSVGRMTQ
jgi:hypothetical protein